MSKFINKYKATFRHKSGKEYVSIVYANSFGDADVFANDDLATWSEFDGGYDLVSIEVIDFKKTFIRTKFGVLETFAEVDDDNNNSIVVTLNGKRIVEVKESDEDLIAYSHDRYDNDYVMKNTIESFSRVK
jgi:hypothetical protein